MTKKHIFQTSTCASRQSVDCIIKSSLLEFPVYKRLKIWVKPQWSCNHCWNQALSERMPPKCKGKTHSIKIVSSWAHCVTCSPNSKPSMLTHLLCRARALQINHRTSVRLTSVGMFIGALKRLSASANVWIPSARRSFTWISRSRASKEISIPDKTFLYTKRFLLSAVVSNPPVGILPFPFSGLASAELNSDFCQCWMSTFSVLLFPFSDRISFLSDTRIGP